MNIREIDWQIESVRVTVAALSNALAVVNQRFEEDGDVDTALDVANDLCGVVFVVAHMYIDGVRRDAEGISGENMWQYNSEFFKQQSPFVADTQLTQMQWCATFSNFFKHHGPFDEWTEHKGLGKQTISCDQERRV